MHGRVHHQEIAPAAQVAAFFGADLGNLQTKILQRMQAVGALPSGTIE